MTIYSLYVYDRHCNCVYYQEWHRTKPLKPAAEGNILPAVSRAVTTRPHETAGQSVTFLHPRNTLNVSSGIVIATTPVTPPPPPSPLPVPPKSETPNPSSSSHVLPFNEEAKLVYGVILSLRQMVRKLSGGDDHFVACRTSTYKIHLFETMSGYKFAMFTDPHSETMRYVLRQVYSGPFLEYVVRNPLSEMDSREHGIDNEHFRNGVDKLVRSQTAFN